MSGGVLFSILMRGDILMRKMVVREVIGGQIGLCSAERGRYLLEAELSVRSGLVTTYSRGKLLSAGVSLELAGSTFFALTPLMGHKPAGGYFLLIPPQISFSWLW